MKDESTDQPLLKAIQRLAAEEHRLYEHGALTDADRARLSDINVELEGSRIRFFLCLGFPYRSRLRAGH